MNGTCNAAHPYGSPSAAAVEEGLRGLQASSQQQSRGGLCPHLESRVAAPVSCQPSTAWYDLGSEFATCFICWTPLSCALVCF